MSPALRLLYMWVDIRVVDMGKFMNGYALGNYHIPPPAWDWTDILVSRKYPTVSSLPHPADLHNGIVGPTVYLRLQ